MVETKQRSVCRTLEAVAWTTLHVLEQAHASTSALSRLPLRLGAHWPKNKEKKKKKKLERSTQSLACPGETKVSLMDKAVMKGTPTRKLK